MRQKPSNYIRSLGGLTSFLKPRKPQDWPYIFLQGAVSKQQHERNLASTLTIYKIIRFPDFSRGQESHFLTRPLRVVKVGVHGLLKKPQPHRTYGFLTPWAREAAGPAVTAGTIR